MPLLFRDGKAAHDFGAKQQQVNVLQTAFSDHVRVANNFTLSNAGSNEVECTCDMGSGMGQCSQGSTVFDQIKATGNVIHLCNHAMGGGKQSAQSDMSPEQVGALTLVGHTL